MHVCARAEAWRSDGEGGDVGEGKRLVALSVGVKVRECPCILLARRNA